MTRKAFYLTNIIFISIAIYGFLLAGFWGGIMVGFSASIILFTTIGRSQAKKAAAKMNKQMRDIIVQNL